MSDETRTTYECLGTIHRDGEVYEPGTRIDLTPEEAAELNERAGKPVVAEPGAAEAPTAGGGP